jgi:hypothetical protein
MPMTDLATLTLPTWAVPAQPRLTAVEGHTVRIRARWWHEAITSRGLPGTWTYQRYCDLLARWAGDLHCAPDEIERTLFTFGPREAV